MMRITKTLLGFIFILFISAFSSSTQLLPTNLRITVLNSLGNAEEGVSVTLYGTEESYRAEENPITETLSTDKKGRVTFTKLETKSYFIHAEKGDMSNTGEGVETAKLEEGRMNKVNIVIQ